MADDLYWIDADGNEYQLTNQSTWIKLQGWTGRFMPTISFVEDDVPYYAGSRLRSVKVAAREVDIPFLVKGNSALELRTNIRNLLRMFDPSRGDGTLRITGPDGMQRDLHCRYSGGFETQESSDSTWSNMQKLALSFHAFDPYWYDSDPTITTWNIGKKTSFFPLLPMHVTSSEVIGLNTVMIGGDVECWPIWIITGPGSAIVLQNQTTGESITFNIPLLLGESITIDTNIGKKTVFKNDGSNQFGSLTPESSLWSLIPGDNTVNIQVTDGNENTSVQLTYRNRYLGA